jgi:hypothetical protein
MLSYTIAMQATISTTAIMNMASSMSTTAKELTENTCNAMTTSRHYQQQQQISQAITRNGQGGARNK